MQQSDVKILIIGGGIGGLASGVALRRHGFDAQIYEAAGELKPVGKGIWVPTNAMQVLDRLGLAGELQRTGWPLARVEASYRNGPPLMVADLRKFEKMFGYTTYSIHRSDLVRILAAGLADRLHTNKRCIRVEGTAGNITAHFDDGTSARGDLLIAADGIRSVVRTERFGPATYRYSGQTCFRGIADLEMPAEIAAVCKEIWGGDVRFGYSALGTTQIYWFAPILAAADAPLPQGDELTAFLLRQYESFPPPIPAIIRHTPAAEIIRTDLYDIAPLASWHRDGVVLLGDAAHAMTPNLGQGGAQAIEDAFVLAESLHRCATPAEAFAAYQRVRMPKANWIAKTAWRLGALAHLRGGMARGIRDMILRTTPQWLSDRSIARTLRLDYSCTER